MESYTLSQIKNNKEIMKRVCEFSIEMSNDFFKELVKTDKSVCNKSETSVLKYFQFKKKGLIMGIINDNDILVICHIYVYKEFRRTGVCLEILNNICKENNGRICISANLKILQFILKHKLPYLPNFSVQNKDNTVDCFYKDVFPEEMRLKLFSWVK